MFSVYICVSVGIIQSMWNPNGDCGLCAGPKLPHIVATSRELGRLRSMAALYGHIGEFVETQEEWRQYAERIQHYFAANGVTDAERKRAYSCPSLVRGPTSC